MNWAVVSLKMTEGDTAVVAVAIRYCPVLRNFTQPTLLAGFAMFDLSYNSRGIRYSSADFLAPLQIQIA